MPIQKQIHGVLCEEVEVQDLSAGDTIFNPWSHNPADHWLAANVRSLPDGRFELGTVAGGDRLEKGSKVWRVVS